MVSAMGKASTHSILKAAVSKYVDAKDGKEKTRYRDVGRLLQRPDGSFCIQLDAFFNFSALKKEEWGDVVYLSCFNPEPNKYRNNGNGNRR